MLWTCLDCSTQYSVGAPCCPHCGGTEHAETGTVDSEGAAAVLDDVDAGGDG